MRDASNSQSEEIEMKAGVREGGTDEDTAGNDVFEMHMERHLYGQKPSVLDCLGCINRSEFQNAAHVNKRFVLLITALAILLFASNAYYWFNDRALSGQISRLQQYVSQLENSNQVLTERVNNNQYWHHVVFEGQTLADISNNFYGSEDYVDDIATLNNISDIYELQVGQEILIPTINIKRNEPNE